MDKAFYMLALIIFASFAQSEVKLKNTGNGEDHIFLHDGLERTYKLYRPKSLPKDSPMLLLLHGQGSSNRWTFVTGFNVLAEQHGFLVVYPQSHKKEARLDGALAQQPGMPKHLIPMLEKIAKCQKGEFFTYSAMNFTCQANGVGVTHMVMWNQTNEDSLFDSQSDVAFLKSLTEHLQKKFHIDPNKTFLAGFSNGGGMTYTLICQTGNLFKAGAIVAGLAEAEILNDCARHPKPIIHIHGADDSIAPISPERELTQGSTQVGAKDSVEFFANLNDLVTVETNQVTESALQRIYKPQSGGAEVQYYRIENHGHVWPGRAIEVKKGMDNSGLNATELIWDFFSTL